jgi:large subunit ribosomal protein L10
MSKPVKSLIIDELSRTYEGIDSACVVDLTGLDAISTHKVRGGLREQGIRLQVVKNRMARQAFKGTPLEALGAYLDGPCALATGGESVVDVAKTLASLAKDYPALTLKKGIIEGDADLVEVVELAKWKGRTELRGELAMLVTSPGRRIAGCLTGPAGIIAGCIQAIIDKQERGDSAEAA